MPWNVLNLICMPVATCRSASVCSSNPQRAVNKEKAYRKLLLRSANNRTMMSSDIRRHLETKRSSVSQNIPIVKFKDGSMPPIHKTRYSVADFNRTRHNYNNYSHFRVGTAAFTNLRPTEAESNFTQHNEHPVKNSQSQVAEIVTRMHVRLSDVTQGNNPVVRTVAAPHKHAYNLRGYSASPMKICGEYHLTTPAKKPDETTTDGHVSRSSQQPQNTKPKSRNGSRITLSTECLNIKAEQMTPLKRNKSATPRPGTFGSYPHTHPNSVVQLSLNDHDLKRVENLGEELLHQERNNLAYKKLLQPTETRWQMTFRDVKGSLPLTQKNLGMLEENYKQQSQENDASMRVLKWIKDRDVHLGIGSNESSDENHNVSLEDLHDENKT